MSRSRLIVPAILLALCAPAAAQDPAAPKDKPAAPGQDPAAPKDEGTAPKGDLTAGLADGLYAIIETNMGTMVASLDYDKVPHTVGNFVGLAEGTLAWKDSKTGQEVTGKPFYDGLTFHRILKDFMIQGGCPLGNGQGGPGYSFFEEFHPELKHSGPGILSMAKTQQPNTTGSQFFITLKATSWLDNRHSVFGKLVKGVEILEAIGGVPVKPAVQPKAPGDRGVPPGSPVEAVTIKHITIHRVGDKAKAWKIKEVCQKDVPAAGEADPARVWDPKAAPAIKPNEQGVFQAILIRYKGLQAVSPLNFYSKEEARAIADKIVALARAKDGDFQAIAEKYSDIPANQEVPLRNDPRMPEFLKPAFTLSGTQVSDPIDLPTGWAILTPAKSIEARHILISYKGTPLPGMTRSKEEAKALAEDLLKKLKAGGNWDELVKQSDDNRSPGGRLGRFGKTMMVKPFADAAFKLEVNAICDEVVESQFGFHIIQRTG